MIGNKNVHKPFALLRTRANHRSCKDTSDRCFPCLRRLNYTQAYLEYPKTTKKPHLFKIRANKCNENHHLSEAFGLSHAGVRHSTFQQSIIHINNKTAKEKQLEIWIITKQRREGDDCYGSRPPKAKIKEGNFPYPIIPRWELVRSILACVACGGCT